jgi:arginyl-tRNA synthetase
MSSADSEPYFIDKCRESIAKAVSTCLHIEFDTAYGGVDLGKKGVDFTVAMPRFRLKEKPQELAERVQNHVRRQLYSI